MMMKHHFGVIIIVGGDGILVEVFTTSVDAVKSIKGLELVGDILAIEIAVVDVEDSLGTAAVGRRGEVGKPDTHNGDAVEHFGSRSRSVGVVVGVVISSDTNIDECFIGLGEDGIPTFTDANDGTLVVCELGDTGDIGAHSFTEEGLDSKGGVAALVPESGRSFLRPLFDLLLGGSLVVFGVRGFLGLEIFTDGEVLEELLGDLGTNSRQCGSLVCHLAGRCEGEHFGGEGKNIFLVFL